MNPIESRLTSISTTLDPAEGAARGLLRRVPNAGRLLLLILVSLGAVACAPPKAATYQAEYLFVDHLDTAQTIQKSRRGGLTAPHHTIGHDERRVLFQHAAAAHRFGNVPSGPNARFVAAPTMLPRSWDKTNGAGFEAVCRAPDGSWLQLLEMKLYPRKNPKHRIWHDSEVSLDGCSQPTTDIELRTDCGPKGNCAADWAAWGQPRVLYDQVLKPSFDGLTILISIDTLRPDRLSVYGAERETSVELERLAADGIVFETAVAPSPWTIPSHASMLTSTHPRVHGANSKTAIAESVPSLAKILGDNGWQTAGFVDSPYLSDTFGFDRGFGHFDDDDAPKGDFRRGANLTRQRLLNWLGSEERTGNAFVFWHLMDVHGPYRAPAPFAGKFRNSVTTADGETEAEDPRLEKLRKLFYHKYLKLERYSSFEDLLASYDEGIAATDAVIGGLFQILRDANLYDDALIIVTSDHGESFLDHDVWVGHGLFLTDDEIRIPLIVKLPKNRHAGTRVKEMVRLLDVAPTILDVLDIGRPPTFEGQSLVSPAPGAPESLPKVAYGFSDNTGVSFLRTDSFKYISPATANTEKIRRRVLKPRANAPLPHLQPLFGEQLYHLRDDAQEKTSLVDHQDSGNQLELFRADVEQHIAASEARRTGAEPGDAPELTEEAKKRLEALGYLSD